MEDMVLTESQEKILVETWNLTPNNPPDLDTLTKAIFGQVFDGRSKEARAVKKALAKHNLKSKAVSTYVPKTDKIELSLAHEQYITNNVATMTPVEMAREIFSNPSLSNLNAETRAVVDYIKKLHPAVVFDQQAVDNTPKGDYEPPKTFDQVFRRVNAYVHPPLEKDKITPNDRKNLDRLIGYLHTYRFRAQMNSYETEDDRTLCEDDFIRNTYDKPDLTQEEIAQYIELSNQVVIGVAVQRRSNHLQAMLDALTESNDAENIKVSMSLVEAIGKASTEYHQCIARQEKLLSNLTQKRSARLDKNIKENASVLNLVQQWKNEETRKNWLKIAEKEQESIKNEVDRLATLPELKARILGLTKDEIIYG